MRATVLELCAGAGGSALGLEAVGFSPVALVDIERHCCATLRQNRPYWNVIQADIRKLDTGYWHGVDLVSGGLPCPPFSIAGKRLGSDDERDLFPAMLKVVKTTQPRAVLIENVKGITSARFDAYRENINKRLKRYGYTTYWALFNAAEYGVSQTRWRAFMISLRDGATRPIEWPIPAGEEPSTVGVLLHDLISARGWRLADQWASRANKIAPTIVGGSWKHGGPDLGPTRARAEWFALGVDGRGLADDAPAPSFRGKPRLTVDMVKRIQSFPDDWRLAGAKTAAHRQIGNALPVNLATAIAKSVMRCLV